MAFLCLTFLRVIRLIWVVGVIWVIRELLGFLSSLLRYMAFFVYLLILMGINCLRGSLFVITVQVVVSMVVHLLLLVYQY